MKRNASTHPQPSITVGRKTFHITRDMPVSHPRIETPYLLVYVSRGRCERHRLMRNAHDRSLLWSVNLAHPTRGRSMWFREERDGTLTPSDPRSMTFPDTRK